MTDLFDSSAGVLSRVEAQSTVFSEQPSRADLYQLPSFPITFRALNVRVHRNVAAERLISPTIPFARFAGLDLSVRYESYDDTLSLAALAGADPDVELVWLDAARVAGLSAAQLGDFMLDRLSALRRLTGATILVLDIPGTDARSASVNASLVHFARHSVGVAVCPQSEVAADLGDQFLSQRAVGLTAVPLSPTALMRLAQRLGLCWLPAVSGVRVRGIAVDLDNTLYSGVLGEDGIDGVVVTAAHRHLQQRLVALHERGVFVAVLSKNERGDVRKLFDERDDFAISAADVDAWSVGWHNKSAGLASVAESLRVAPDTFIFLDDNAGELLEVGAHFPDVLGIHAADPELAARALTLAPGLFRFETGKEDSLRTGDLAAAGQREQLRARAGDHNEYLAALEVVLEFGVDIASQVKRLAELSAKTNQFTTALARLNEVQLSERVNDTEARVVSIGISDRLADAGVIAMISARRQRDGSVLVEDVCVSCRALGRGIENAMLSLALARIADDFRVIQLRLATIEGPRNGPARAWLDQLGGHREGNQLIIDVAEPAADLPLTVTWVG